MLGFRIRDPVPFRPWIRNGKFGSATLFTGTLNISFPGIEGWRELSNNYLDLKSLNSLLRFRIQDPVRYLLNLDSGWKMRTRDKHPVSATLFIGTLIISLFQVSKVGVSLVTVI
jgi:hypothetical protein